MNQPNFAERNIQLLGAAYPALAIRLNDCVRARRSENRPPSYQFIERDPQTVLCRRSAGGSGAWIHGPEDPRERARGWIREFGAGSGGLVVVWKAGLGYAARILEREQGASRIVLCESRLELVWEWLCRWDCSAMLQGKRFYWIVEDDCENHLLQLARDYPTLFRSGAAVVPGSEMDEAELGNMRRIASQLNGAEASALDSELDEKNVFFMMSYTLAELTPAILRGMQQNGYTPLWGNRPFALMQFLEGMNLWRDSCKCVPSAALAIYRSFFSPDELRSMGDAGVPRVVWYYDDPKEYLRGDEGPCYDLALAFDPGQLDLMRPIFGSKAQILLPGASFDDFQPQHNFPYPLRPVSYVGHTGYRLSLPHLKKNPQIAPRLMQVVSTVVNEMLGGDPQLLMNRLMESTAPFCPQPNPQFTWLVRMLAVSEIRRAFLNAALPYGLSIFGDALWKDAKLMGPLSGAYAGASLHYERETPELYAASKINLSINHPQWVHAIPFRVYDVLACGGFLLSEYRPILESQFTIGRDLDVFRTPQELAQKIDFYLQNDGLRREIAARGRETVLANHTYRNRISSMMQLLKNPR